ILTRSPVDLGVKMDEVGLYTVTNGKISEERFYY
ncbi:nuclear transport factor 2 family protein, partial [Mesorhizobium sp. M1C.F.Ca.ET.212.01.1.1]